jgi:nucleotidyltransferase/DNA polymerase involved in DNA repair
VIACVYIPEFAIAVARTTYTGLTDDILVLTHQEKSRSKVYAASPLARQMGIRPGLGVSRARSLCPDAQYVALVPSRHRQAADALLETLALFSKRLEIEVDHGATLWLDLGQISDCEARARGRQIKQHVIDHTVFLPGVGCASGKFTARIAAVQAGEGQLEVVVPGKEAAYLASFPLARLALEGPLQRKFALLGLETLGQLAKLSKSAALSHFGKTGRTLRDLALGQDLRPVAHYQMRQTEQITHPFEPAVENRQIVELVLRNMAGTLAECLKQRNFASQEITLTLCLENKQIVETQQIPREAIQSHFALSSALLSLLKPLDITAGVSAVEVTLADLKTPLPRQLDFFSQWFADSSSLDQVVAQLQPRHEAEPFRRVHRRSTPSYFPEEGYDLDEAGTA